MKKRLLACFLCVGLLAGMVGCTQKNETTVTSGSEATQSSEGGTKEGDTVAEAEKSETRSKVTVMIPDYSGQGVSGEHADEVMEIMEEYTNTDVEITFVPSDAYNDKATLTLASGSNTPQIIVMEMSAQVANYAKAGAFWDLSQFINEEDYPNLSQANPDINQNVTIDGQLIGIYRGRTYGRNGLGWRQDWAEKLGLSEPETIDDVYNMLHAFTYDDPDGNGKDDTYGMEICSYAGPWNIMQTWFGVGNGWFEDEDGLLKPVFMQPEYEEALDWFRKCYSEGLFPSDFATRETGNYSDECKKGLAGMFCDTVGNSIKVWKYFQAEETFTPSVVNQDESAVFMVRGTIGKTSADEDQYTLPTTGYSGFFVITKDGAKTEEEVKAALHYLDKMNDPEMLMLTGYGIEGVHWERGEGNVYVDIRKDADTEQYAYGGLNQLEAYIPYLSVPSDYISFQSTDMDILRDKIYESNNAYAVADPSLALLMQSATYTSNGAVLQQIIDDARINYIVGGISKDELKAQWELYLSSGGSKIIDEVNAAR